MKTKCNLILTKKFKIMKKFSISAFLSMLLIVVLVTSCTIQKRRYMPGYHINRIGNRPVAETKSVDKNFDKTINLVEAQEQINITEVDNIAEDQPLLFASDNELNIIARQSDNSTLTSKAKNNSKSLVTTSENECDIIVLINGNEISAVVLDVGQNEVKYLLCNNVHGPTYTINKSEILKIKFANGTTTVISQSTQDNSNADSSVANKENKSSGKKLIVALLLWFFLGGLGIHRFYLGHTGMGVLYLLTGALCGIGWIIDGIRFAVGTLQPKNGKYDD